MSYDEKSRKQYLLSIVIPTKNRQKYCLAAVHQILGLHMSGVQIVVQDNSDLPSLECDFQNTEDENLIYHYNPAVLSFVDNFSEAVSLTTGEYVCMIGDDDGILPDILSAAEFAKRVNADAIIPGLNSVYVWPSSTPFIPKSENGYLCLSYLKSTLDVVDVATARAELLQAGGQNYQSFDLPRIYHGLVHRRALCAIKDKIGTYFGGLTPDIYMSTALSFVCNKVYRLGFPLTVSGICPGSGSSNSATGKHTGKLADAPHFVGHASYEWSALVPAIYSVETIWADTMLHALEDFGSSVESEQFSVDTLIAICQKKYPQFRTELKEFSVAHRISQGAVWSKKIKCNIFPFARRVVRRVLRKQNDVLKYYTVTDLEQAVALTEERIQSLNMKAVWAGNDERN